MPEAKILGRTAIYGDKSKSCVSGLHIKFTHTCGSANTWGHQGSTLGIKYQCWTGKSRSTNSNPQTHSRPATRVHASTFQPRCSRRSFPHHLSTMPQPWCSEPHLCRQLRDAMDHRSTPNNYDFKSVSRQLRSNTVLGPQWEKTRKNPVGLTT